MLMPIENKLPVIPEEDYHDIKLDENEDTNINEFKGEQDDYKMDTIIQKIQQNDVDELREFVSQNFPEIPVSKKSTIPSLSDKLIEYIYNNASQKQIRDSFNVIRGIINEQSPNLNQRAKRFTSFRKLLKQRFGNNHPLVSEHKKKGMTFEDHASRNKTQAKVRNQKLSNQVTVDEKDIMAILNETFSSDDVFDNIIALQLATGARFIEAVKLSTFKKIPNEPNMIEVSGIAKKRSEDDLELKRPLLGLSPDEVIELSKRIRKILKREYPSIRNASNDDITKTLINNVNNRLKKYNIDGVKSSHDLRRLYVNLSYKNLPTRERKRLDKGLFIANTLGHSNMMSAPNYRNIRVQKSKFKINNQEDIEKKIQQIDETDIRQDSEIQNIEDELKLEPDIADRTRSHRIVKLTNKNGEVVSIFDKISAQRGLAVDRAKDIMKQMYENKVKITEEILKKQFNIGSNTIAKIKDLKKELNNKLK